MQIGCGCSQIVCFFLSVHKYCDHHSNNRLIIPKNTFLFLITQLFNVEKKVQNNNEEIIKCLAFLFCFWHFWHFNHVVVVVCCLWLIKLIKTNLVFIFSKDNDKKDKRIFLAKTNACHAQTTYVRTLWTFDEDKTFEMKKKTEL